METGIELSLIQGSSQRGIVMGVITLNVLSSDKGAKKTMQFEPSTLVFDACKIIREKMVLNDVNRQSKLYWYTFERSKKASQRPISVGFALVSILVLWASTNRLMFSMTIKLFLGDLVLYHQRQSQRNSFTENDEEVGKFAILFSFTLGFKKCFIWSCEREGVSWYLKLWEGRSILVRVRSIGESMLFLWREVVPGGKMMETARRG